MTHPLPASAGWLLIALAACRSGTEPEPAVHTRTVTQTLPAPRTVTVPQPVPSTGGPGRYSPVLQHLAQVFDDRGAVGTHGVLEDHMHVDELRYRESDQRFFYCGYTFGVVDVADPTRPEYLAQGFEWDLDSPVDRATGCLHLDWDDANPDIVYVSHRGNHDFQPHLSVVDLATTFDPKDVDNNEPFYAPVQHPPLQEEGVSYEGLDAEGGRVYVALHADGIGVYERDTSTQTMVRVGGDDTLVPNAYDIDVVGTTAYVLDEQLGLFILDVADPNAIVELGHLFVGGVDRDLTIDGDLAYIAGGGAGLVIVDISDPASPTLVSATDTHGTAVRLAYDAGRVAVAAWNDTRVFDVTDPTAPALLGAARLEIDKVYAGDESNELPDITARTLAVDLAGDEVFIGNWWTPHTYRLHPERTAPYVVLPEDVYYMGMGSVPTGSSATYHLAVRNHGTAPLQIIDAWVGHPDFQIEPSKAEVAAGGRVDLTITYSASSEEEAAGVVHLLTDDPVQPLRQGYVVGNAEGVGVGDPLPYTEATEVHSLASWSSDELEGEVALLAYFATF